jgi:hypothetical protein
LLFENEYVRVLDTRVLPGRVVPLDTQQWPSLLSSFAGASFIRCAGEAAVAAIVGRSLQSPQQVRYGQPRFHHTHI